MSLPGKVRIAVVGCGAMAGSHARRLRDNPEVEFVALCDADTGTAAAFQQKFLPDCEPAPALYTDAAAMYREARPDAVIIVTPHTLHFTQMMQALDAGCHVFVEKPMVTESGQARAVEERVRETGKILVIGYNSPTTANFGYLRGVIRSGELGRLEMVTGWLTQEWKKSQAGTWRQNPALSGGGQMYDSGAHLFNSLVWTVEQPVAQVHAFVDNQDTPVDINGTVNIRFENGVLATILISGSCRSFGTRLTYIFEEGIIEIDGTGGSWITVKKGDEEISDLPITAENQTPAGNFIEAILDRALPCTTPLNGVIQSELMDAIYESARSGTSVTVK